MRMAVSGETEGGRQSRMRTSRMSMSVWMRMCAHPHSWVTMEMILGTSCRHASNSRLEKPCHGVALKASRQFSARPG